MSKIGKKPLTIPDTVNVIVEGKQIKVKGPKGEMVLEIATEDIDVKVENKELLIERANNENKVKALHGLYSSMITNMMKGVVVEFNVRLSLVGVGYRVQKKGDGLNFTLGFSHPIEIKAVKGVNFVLEGDTNVIVQGIDKQLVGQVAANIRSLRGPEPYKGKGIRYANEKIRRKAGKAGKKK